MDTSNDLQVEKSNAVLFNRSRGNPLIGVLAVFFFLALFAIGCDASGPETGTSTPSAGTVTPENPDDGSDPDGYDPDDGNMTWMRQTAEGDSIPSDTVGCFQTDYHVGRKVMLEDFGSSTGSQYGKIFFVVKTEDMPEFVDTTKAYHGRHRSQWVVKDDWIDEGNGLPPGEEPHYQTIDTLTLDTTWGGYDFASKIWYDAENDPDASENLIEFAEGSTGYERFKDREIPETHDDLYGVYVEKIIRPPTEIAGAELLDPTPETGHEGNGSYTVEGCMTKFDIDYDGDAVNTTS